jgi:succinate dehydrogenase (ubiquinone) iron-sulfur subunit
LACLAKVDKDVAGSQKIAPLPHMFVVRDLVVDMANFYSQYKAIEPYLKVGYGTPYTAATAPVQLLQLLHAEPDPERSV